MERPLTDGPASRSKLKAWWQASRPPFYIATLAPLTLGFVLAADATGQWLWGRFLLVNLGAFMIHLATNLANDLFDHVLGADAGESIGGSRVIQEGLISPTQLAWALVILFAGGLITAWLLVNLSGRPEIWAMAIFSGLSAFFYVAPPIKYGYRALGELSVFINMGLIMVGGSFLALSETWRWDVLLYAAPIGLMVANILFYQSLPDIKTDARIGKRTLAVRVGKKGSLQAFRWWWGMTYLSLIGLNLINLASPLVWLCLATIPIFLKTDRLIRETRNWVDLNNHGHLVRKLYLINSLILILSV